MRKWKSNSQRRRRAPVSWRPAPEARPQGPKVAHCGGTGVCAVLGPFAPAQLGQGSIVLLEAARPLRHEEKASTPPPGSPFVLLPLIYYYKLVLHLRVIRKLKLGLQRRLSGSGTLFVVSIRCQGAVGKGAPPPPRNARQDQVTGCYLDRFGAELRRELLKMSRTDEGWLLLGGGGDILFYI